MALVQKVRGIIAKAEEIQQLSMFSRPAEYEKLVSAEIVPLLLEVARHIDEFNSPAELPDGAVSVAEVLNEFQGKISDMQKDLEFACSAVNESKAENEKLQQEITTLKGRVTKIQKSGTGAAA